MVHLEFRQDRLAQPHPLQAFELAKRSAERPLEACCVRALERSRCSRPVTTVVSARGPETLGSFLNPAVAAPSWPKADT